MRLDQMEIPSVGTRESTTTTINDNDKLPHANKIKETLDQRETLGDIPPKRSTRDSLVDHDNETEDGSQDLDDEDHMMPGLLNEGIAYTIQSVLVQGWVSKKGTGQDLFASRAWKTRWAVLSLARIAGHDTNVPMLQIYWNESAPTPSTVIVLNSAVILPTQGPDPAKWNFYRFEIRHVKKPMDDSFGQVTRVFSCPQEGRDRWVYAMNEALLEYEKAKANRKRLSSSSLPVNEGVPRMTTRVVIPMSPPPLPSKPPAPLHEPPLAGIHFLDRD